MRSLETYIEGMDGLHLLFTGANGSNLAVWARFGIADEKICGNDEYSESIVTVDKIRDHRNPDYNKLNGGGVRELSEFGMILVSRILYYSVRIR